MRWTELLSRIQYLSATDLERVRKAYELGEKAHRGQERKSGEPYHTHPVAVAGLLADMHADADTIIAALLHDTIEDTSLTLEDIQREVNGDAPELIDGVTKLRKEDLGAKPTLEEEVETLRKIFTLMQQDVRIMVIKLADRTHNMQTIDFLDKARRRTFAEETRDIFVKIADRLSMRDLRDELEALYLQILEPDLFEKLSKLRMENEKSGLRIVKGIVKTMATSRGALMKKTDALYEHKSWGRLRSQLEAEGAVATGVSSVTAAFICEDVPSCYQVFGALHELWPREKLSFEDFINTPMINGYQGLHTTIILKNGTRVRCKIRTEEMQEYAHKGITTKCFDSEAVGILDYLPWTDRIATLAEDTLDRSAQFWESLQSDILGETIIIHGPNDRSISLPVGATALDGALYLIGEKALEVTTIKVNGKEAPFSQPLKQASTLDFAVADKPQVKLEWLEWTNTGFASALIRSALAQQSDRQKTNIGRQLLQETLAKHKKGFIEEFEEESIFETLRTLGYDSMKEAYVAVADGRLDPEEVYISMFTPKHTLQSLPTKLCSICYTQPLDDYEAWQRTTHTHQKYRQHFTKLTVKHQHHLNRSKVKTHARLSPEQQNKFITELKSAGATDVRIILTASHLRYSLGIMLLITLWGLDPAFARFILNNGVSAYELTLIRFVTFFFAATFLYALQSQLATQKLKPLSPWDKSLVASSLALFLTALSSYLALSLIHADQYILIIIGGLTLAELVNKALFAKGRYFYLLITSCSTILALTLLLYFEGTAALGLLFAAIASLGFVIYSRVSSAFQSGVIHARYPAYLFWLSIFALPFVLLLLPKTAVLDIDPTMLFASLSFVLIFAFLPYGLYFECMRGVKNGTLDRMLPFVFISTLFGELFFTHELTSLLVLPLALVFLWQYRVMQRSAT